MLSIADAAKRLKTTDQHVRKLCRRGDLRAERVAGVWVIAESDLAAFVPRPRGRPPRYRDDGL